VGFTHGGQHDLTFAVPFTFTAARRFDAQMLPPSDAFADAPDPARQSDGSADALSRAAGTDDVGRRETRLRSDVKAPSAARRAVAHALVGRVTDAVLGSVQLLVSELVTNSVRHSGGTPTDLIVVRVELTLSAIRLEVEDPGDGRAVALREPDVDRGGGFGLTLVQTVSERWGLDRLVGGGTRVWAELPWEPGGSVSAAT
jgi:anti-sigma regulatory factor (Ser/Thr protein kinase)